MGEPVAPDATASVADGTVDARPSSAHPTVASAARRPSDPAPLTASGDHPARSHPVRALERQAGAALRSALRPSSYLGLAREALLTTVHVAAYPLGLLPPIAIDAAPAPSGLVRRPVVLVHGWVHNRSAFLLMQRALRRAGLGPLHAFDYPSVSTDLAVAAVRLAETVERVVDHADARSCVLIGHSMGGLVARQYVQELGGDRLVDTVVTLGTPHRGTFNAYLGVGRSIIQCRPGSRYLRRLERTAAPGLADWVAYYGDLDLMVTPAISAKLLHPALAATNVRVRDNGHLSLLLSRAVTTDVVRRLVAPRSA